MQHIGWAGAPGLGLAMLALAAAAQTGQPGQQAPSLADFLPAPPAALAAAAAPCSAEPLRTSTELGPLDEGQDTRAQLLRAWGQRRLRWTGGAEGCIAWGRVVRAWQQASGGVVNGELGLADLDRLQTARMAQFAAYREALTAWQQGRVAAINQVPENKPEAPAADLMEARVPDSLADSVLAEFRVPEKTDPRLVGVGCPWASEVLKAALECKAAVDSGLLPAGRLASAHYSLASHYLRQNDLPRCLMHLTRSLEVDGRQGFALAFRGDVLRQLRAYARAQLDFDAAIGLLQADKPKLALAYANRALLMADLGNFRAAHADNEEALRHDPTNKLALSNRLPLRQRAR